MKSVGRKQKYGEPTVPMRIPESMVPVVEELLAKREVLSAQFEASLLPPVAEKLIQRISVNMEAFTDAHQDRYFEIAELMVSRITDESHRNKFLMILKEQRDLRVLEREEFKDHNPSILRALLSASIASDEESVVLGVPGHMIDCS